jgi:putative membrane protein
MDAQPSAQPVESTSTTLAVDRTRLAHERTLMAWLRTSASLISFGFTVYKFFQTLVEKGQAREGRLFGPREFALFMIGIGVVALLLATAEHRREMVEMRKLYAKVPYSIATVIAGLVGIFGLICFVAVIFRQ